MDPDGRAGCTGTRITSVCEGGGVAGLRTSASGVAATEVSAAAANPEGFIQRLNKRANAQQTEGGSAAYFARAAMPVTLGTGREVGADIANTFSGARPFTVVNFSLGAKAAGDGSGSVELGQAYSGPGVRVALAHTHAVNNNFSGLPASWGRAATEAIPVIWRGSSLLKPMDI